MIGCSTSRTDENLHGSERDLCAALIGCFDAYSLLLPGEGKAILFPPVVDRWIDPQPALEDHSNYLPKVELSCVHRYIRCG